MIARLGLKLSAIFQRIVPDPFVIAVALTLITAVGALLLGSFPALDSDTPRARLLSILDAWRGGEGLWKFLAFGMQMCLILVTGHALAASRSVSRAIERLASVPRSAHAAGAFVALIAALAGLINWGLGLIVGALLAREVARALSRRGVRVHYPLLVAAGYMGLLVWHGGLSGSAPLSSTTIEQMNRVFPADSVALIGEQILTPLDQSLGSTLNLLATGGAVLLIPLIIWFLCPRHDHDRTPPPDALLAQTPAPASPPADEPSYAAARLDRSPIVAGILAGLILLALARHAQVDGLTRIGPNEINLAMLALGLIAHGSLRSYATAAEEACRGCAGIMLQFPLYAGILAMLRESGLILQTAEFLRSISTPETLPLATMTSAALVNLAVPSGGGQWGIQGPIAMQTAVDMGVSPARMIMAVSYGDQLTNMLQPFWALPLLAITGAKARDIVGYTAIVMLAVGAWFALALFLF